MIPPLRDVGPTKFTSCALIASTDLEKALDTVKEVIEGAGAPSAMMGNRPAKSPSRLATVGGQLNPLDVGHLSPARQSSPAAQGHGSHPIHALSPRPTIQKEHR
jgi:hypothetical protein